MRALSLLYAAALCLGASGYEVEVQVPLYCQKDPIWCGAAVTQMIVESYRVSIPHDQSVFWYCIQRHKSDPGVNWATDPEGLMRCLNRYMPSDGGGEWAVRADKSFGREMYAVLYWMSLLRHPAPVLIWNQQHWVIVTGFVSDVDPATHERILLRFIEFNNPWPPCRGGITEGGVYHYASAAQWKANYFWGPVDLRPSKWYGKYVAVLYVSRYARELTGAVGAGEPPLGPGRYIHIPLLELPERAGGECVAPDMVRQGTPLPPEAASEYALRWIAEYRLHEKGPLGALREGEPLEPLLVNPSGGGYYIVPFGSGRVATAGIAVNAYTGEFLDASVFRAPIRYIYAGEAAEILEGELGIPPEGRQELVFTPTEWVLDTLFQPLWKFELEGVGTFYLDQAGRIYRTPPPPLPGQ